MTPRHGPVKWTTERPKIVAMRAAGMTHAAIAEQTGVPRRSVSYILAHDQDVAQAVAVETREQITRRLWDAFSLAVEQVTTGLADPKQRLGDKVQALRIIGEQHALLTGRSTQNIATRDATEGMSDDQREMLRQLVAGATTAEETPGLDLADAATVRSLIAAIEARLNGA